MSISNINPQSHKKLIRRRGWSFYITLQAV
jgi:hypothetical protein